MPPSLSRGGLRSGTDCSVTSRSVWLTRSRSYLDLPQGRPPDDADCAFAVNGFFGELAAALRRHRGWRLWAGRDEERLTASANANFPLVVRKGAKLPFALLQYSLQRAGTSDAPLTSHTGRHGLGAGGSGECPPHFAEPANDAWLHSGFIRLLRQAFIARRTQGRVAASPRTELLRPGCGPKLPRPRASVPWLGE